MGEEEDTGRIRGRAVGCPSLVTRSGTTVTLLLYVALAESHTTTKGQRKADEMQMQMQEGA